MKKIITLTVICVFAFWVIAGCGATAQPITGAERDAVLAFAEPKTENLLNGFNADDYAMFSRDFDAAMRQGLNQSAFEQTRAQITSRVGRYISRQVTSVARQDNFIVVLYNGRFENEDGVTMRVVFTPDDAHQITGLWFDSPKLREK